LVDWAQGLTAGIYDHVGIDLEIKAV
jgi:hypothetical protein